MIVLFEGSGQAYLGYPLAELACDEADLERLLRDLDAQFWNDRRRTWLSVAQGEPFWHDQLLDRGLDGPVSDVLQGRTERLRLPTKAELQRGALLGDPIACFNLGRRLGQAGREWLLKAARKGHLGAMEALGDAGWLEQLVEAKPSPERLRAACHRLSVLAERNQDQDAAIAWLERVVRTDYDRLRLARLHRHDPAKAAYWLAQATVRGEASDLRLDDYVAAVRELTALAAR